MIIHNRQSTIVRSILRWYKRNGRDFSWRRTHDPYRILVSEIMLQQTQASRVVEKYPLFVKRFPNFSSLARAKKSSVVRAWRGMGYNNRAVRLQELAAIVQREHSGRLPNTVDELRQLPGVGPYTANAVACFAFHQDLPAVDTNVRRVLQRLFPREARRADIWKLATAIVPRRRAYDWNQALFDFGSGVCSAKRPACDACPVAKHCPSAFTISLRPLKRSKPERGRSGIPNRIYRGKIVEHLRTLKNNRTVSADRLGKSIKENFSQRDRNWLKGLLRALERDGVIALRNSTSIVRVSLAE